MLVAYIFRDPVIWIVPLIIQIVSYMRILGKMGKKSALGIIPVVGEWAMSHDLYRRMRHFWRNVVFVTALYITAEYLGGEYGAILKFAALIVYGLFLSVLYARLAKQFGKKAWFGAGLILVPLVFLPLLAFDKSEYLGPKQFRPERPHSKAYNILRRAGLVMVSIAELALLIAGCFGITMLVRPVRPMAEYMTADTIKNIADVTDSDEFVSRADTMGEDYMKTVDEQRSRDYYFGDHSGDKKVVVMTYIIGSNLEDGRGCASVNIAQMLDATSKGDGLDFVLEAGGSERWFTKGIDDSTVGRYLISGGKLEKAEMRPETTCMTEPDELSDFIKWTRDNYPADRYMLVLWDHGGGFASGFGIDSLNRRGGSKDTMLSSEIVDVVKGSGIRFDVIGFDACLMQDVELANAFEPYADYYLASQETEPGFGWFYTAGFGRLAEDPTLSTEEFGRSMVTSYDQLYRKDNKGEPQPKNTLSLVDLTLIKPVHDKITGLYEDATVKIKENPAVFADMSAARSKAYEFEDGQQVDMINYLTGLKKADYKQAVAGDEEIDGIIDAARACVVCRNKDSADGINGISIDFTYGGLSSYSGVSKELKRVGYTKQRSFFDNFLSIMAAQKKVEVRSMSDFWKALSTDGLSDYSDEEWYVKGYEDYDTTDLFIDIPVEEAGDAYLPQLPEKTWDTVLDSSVIAYMDTEDGRMYLGQEHFSKQDADGHQLLYLPDKWASIGGRLVCYETETATETDDGLVYNGSVRARLNGTEDITLHIEWDPVKNGDENEADKTEGSDELKGRILGYSLDDEEDLFFMRKGYEHLETGDVIEFMFDWYDDNGKVVRTAPYGKSIRVITEDRLSVTDEPFEAGTALEYYGILTDVYQRELMTEAVNRTVGQ